MNILQFSTFYLLLAVWQTGVIAQTADAQVRVQLTKFDSPIVSVLWCGSSTVITDDFSKIEMDSEESKKVVFLLTDAGYVYKSIDEGFSFVNTTARWKEKYQKDHFQLKDFMVNSIQISPADNKLIFFFGENGKSFYSENCGKDYSYFSHAKTLTNFRLNREKRDHLLALQAQLCNSYDEDSENDLDARIACDISEKKLVASHDFGMTWEIILQRVLDANWDKLLHFSIIPDERIIATHKVEQSIGQSGKSFWRIVVSYSDDFYKTSTIVQENAYQFFQTEFYLFILTSPSEISPNYQLKIASCYQGDYKPNDIELPLANTKHHSFTVLDTTEGFVQIAVNHLGEESRFTNIYLSDYRGLQFTLSLLYAVRDSEGNIDCEKILGSEGVYIANVYDNKELEKYMAKSKKGSSKTNERWTDKDLNAISHYKKTLISYDYGATWRQIKAPEVDTTGNPIQCSGDCSLHLRGRTEVIGNPIYSNQEAPGIIIATGNIGNYLSSSAEINTFFTRDGGYTWHMFQNHSHIYEIGDHGGLIITAKDSEMTNFVHYTWDQGLTWEKLKIANSTLDVTNIIIEPTNMAQRFLLYGQKRTKGSNDEPSRLIGIVAALDFKALHQRVCSGAWEPGAVDSDYEIWQPANYQGDKCVFGRKIRYVRRKRDVQCFNSEEYDKKTFIDRCNCTEEDWECDFGFHRENNLDGPCVPLSKKYEKLLDRTPPADCRYNYEVTRGYRKLPNFCYNGVDHSPELLPCPSKEEKIPVQDTSDLNLQTEEQTRTARYQQQQQRKNKQRDTPADNSWIQSLINSPTLHFVLFFGGIYAFYAFRKEIGQGFQRLKDLIFAADNSKFNRRYEELRQVTKNRGTPNNNNSSARRSNKIPLSEQLLKKSDQTYKLQDNHNDDDDEEEEEEVLQDSTLMDD